MILRLTVALATATVLFAQTPDFTGVWKIKSEASKGVPPGDYLEIFEKKDPGFIETTGNFGQREYRSKMTLDVSGKEGWVNVRGVPHKATSTWDGNTLVVKMKGPAPQNAVIIRKYSLSPDGKTLTIDVASSMNGRDQQQTYVLDRADTAAGERLTKAEAKASASHKNLKLLGDMPNSDFIDVMNYFAVSLGGNCGTCHVQGDFASDDKKEKVTARQMITMTGKINQEYFGGHTEVRCYTCHHGNEHPRSRPDIQ